MKLLMPRRDSNLEVIIPAEGNATTPVSGVSYAWGAWNQVTSGVGYEFVCCGAYIAFLLSFPINNPNILDNVQWQLGQGAAGSETVIAAGMTSWFGSNSNTEGSANNMGFMVTWKMNPILIASSTRLAMRFTQSHSANLMFLSNYLYGYNATIFSLPVGNINWTRYIKGLSLRNNRVAPLAAAGNVVTAGGSAWTYGSWVEFIASADNDLLIKSLALGPPITPSRHVQAKIGIGAADSEVAMAKVGFPGRTVVINQLLGPVELLRSLYVKKGERVAVQIASSSASYAPQVYMSWEELI